MEKATLGGGCFWCLDAVFRRVDGVKEVISGYAGGQTDHPDYSSVCGGETGHAEVVQITFDPEVVSYRGLLDIFFTIHDPTTLNRQGNDTGTQYRSVIFYHDEAQKQETEKLIAGFLNVKKFPNDIVTQIAPLPVFYPAEEYHQDYYNQNMNQPYCAYIIRPKLEKIIS